MNTIKQNPKKPASLLLMLSAWAAGFILPDKVVKSGWSKFPLRYGWRGGYTVGTKKGYHKGCFGSPRFKGYRE